MPGYKEIDVSIRCAGRRNNSTQHSSEQEHKQQKNSHQQSQKNFAIGTGATEARRQELSTRSSEHNRRDDRNPHRQHIRQINSNRTWKHQERKASRDKASSRTTVSTERDRVNSEGRNNGQLSRHLHQIHRSKHTPKTTLRVLAYMTSTRAQRTKQNKQVSPSTATCLFDTHDTGTTEARHWRVYRSCVFEGFYYKVGQHARVRDFT